jgi:hypothetical protein
MKRLLYILTVMLLTSCLSEPKKDIKTKVVKSMNKNKTAKKDSVKDIVVKNLEFDILENDPTTMNLDKISLPILEELIFLSKDNFDNIAIQNNFQFYELKDFDYFEAFVYKKGNNFLTIKNDKYHPERKLIIYQTIDKNLVRKLKEDCNQKGYEESSEIMGKEIGRDDFVINKFTNTKFKISIINSVQEGLNVYNISIETVY